MLNSLVRVSRRDRWMAYKTPQIVETMHRKASNMSSHSTRHSAMSASLRKPTQTPVCATSNGLVSPYTATHHSARQESITGYTPKSTTLPSSQQQSSSIADRGDSIGKTANQHTPQTTRVPNKRIHNAAHEHIRRHQPLHQLGLHPFTSERFHALLNSLFKVLFNFPSRYLFAIGLVLYVALDGVYHPIRSAFPSKPTLE